MDNDTFSDIKFKNKSKRFSKENKIVYMIDPTSGIIVKKFSNAHEASLFIKKDCSNVIRACNGFFKSCGGFIWINEKDFSSDNVSNKIKILNTRKKPDKAFCDRVSKLKSKNVYQIDPATLFILNKFSSIKEAAKSVNVHPSNISRAVNNHSKLCGGFVWKTEPITI
jgi:hypothetical protein